MDLNIKQSLISFLISKIEGVNINDMNFLKDIHDELSDKTKNIFLEYKESTLNQLIELQEKDVSVFDNEQFEDELLCNCFLDDIPLTNKEQENIISLFGLSVVEQIEFYNKLKNFNNKFYPLRSNHDISKNVTHFLTLLFDFITEKEKIKEASI